MKKILIFVALVFATQVSRSQDLLKEADSLKRLGFLKPALDKYKKSMTEIPSRETAYRIATTAALMWQPEMRDTAFYYLPFAVENDQNLAALQDPSFLNLLSDPRWQKIEDLQIRRYERNHSKIKNPIFAKELFRMIIEDQGFTYIRKTQLTTFSSENSSLGSPSLYPMLSIEEEKFRKENIERLRYLLVKYGWPTAADVTPLASDAIVEIVMKAPDELMLQCFPYLSEAFRDDKVSASVYANAKDRFLISKGREQLYGTQIEHRYGAASPVVIRKPEKVDRRREKIGLRPLNTYLEEEFDIEWQLTIND